LQWNAERGRNHCRYSRGVSRRCQLNEPDAVAELLGRLGGGMEGEPRLTDPADPGQRHRSVPDEQLTYPGELNLPTDETCRLLGQVARHSIHREFEMVRP
jgi:hypothetical protein